MVNDGSNDRTSFLAHEFARRYPDVFRVIDKDNGGYGSTVNRAIREARGTYFKLLDADDQYDTDNLEIFIEELQKTDADMVLTDYVECRKDEQRKVSYPFPKETLLDPKALDCDLGMHAICYKTSLLVEHSITLREKCLYTDTEFVAFPLFYVTNLFYIPLVIYKYTLDLPGQSVSVANRVRHADEALTIYKDVVAYSKANFGKAAPEKLVNRKLAAIAKFYVNSILMMDCSKRVKEKLIAFDKEVKDLSPEVYSMMDDRCIQYLRKSNYRMYIICAMYVKYMRT